MIEYGDPGDEIVQAAKDKVTSFEKAVIDSYGINLEAYLESSDLFNEAYSDMIQGNFETAISGFNKSLEKNENHPQCYGNIGLCYAFLGMREQALEALDQAIKIDPHYEPALNNRKMIEKLHENEKLDLHHIKPIEYYKDRYEADRNFAQLKASFNRAFEKINRED